jgi:eukaryotic-like serine/threonine-protein kinase
MTNAQQNGSPPEVTEGQIVGGKWRIVRLIGRGGMGAVYEGRHVSVGNRVALKFIDADFAQQPEIATRFQREAQAAAAAASAHIIQVFDVGETEQGLPYIVMELLVGEDLRSRMRRLGGRIEAGEALHIVGQVLRGLRRAHEAGIVHRDLKPDNIFVVDRDDDPLFVKIVDFGISKVTPRADISSHNTITRQGVVLGTPFYMSPEQAQAVGSLDERTDLWSVGAILFECLTGHPPYGGDSYEQIIISICTTDAPFLNRVDPAIPGPIAAFVARALTRNRNERFQSAKEMFAALRETQAMLGLPRTADPLASAPDLGARSVDRDAPWTPATRANWTAATPSRLPGGWTASRRVLVLVGALSVLAGIALVVVIGRTSAPVHQARVLRAAVGAPSAEPSSLPSAAASASAAPIATGTAPMPTVAPSAAPPAATKSKKAAPTAPQPPAVVSASPHTTPSAATPKTGPGVAGGLQIKTTYP